MNLPTNLTFSQSSLQDFEQCPRRFRLRYIEQQRWPAIESEPVAEAERLARLGADFHRLVHQHLIGLEPSLLSDSLAAQSADLRRWWNSYLAQRPPQLAEAAALYPELKLSASLRGYLLLARFDALAHLADGTFLIIDWKTAHNKPTREALARRMQTRVLSFLRLCSGQV
jgi:RecB family exonuclease